MLNTTNPSALIQKERFPKPILKWVGGKSQIMPTVMGIFPKQMNNYREIFMGGGSVLLAFLSQVRAGHIVVDKDIVAYDANAPLIGVYRNIQNNLGELFECISSIVTEFNACRDDGALCRTPATLEVAMALRENYYYWTRLQYNALTDQERIEPRGSAIFIFLNKTCFRGMFRMGPRGFNVPYGNYKRPEIVSWDHLVEINDLIRSVKFECCDFAESLKCVEVGDFVYMDPPYAPPTEGTSFVGYTACGFNNARHDQLFQCIHDVAVRARILLSNADVPLVRANFNPPTYITSVIECRRSINSKNPGQMTMEVLITNS